ncbi:hypothetical protein PCASD_20673 [Puccinia coronata f. sp. avenae]|uniref:Uncharacterized protein n=1 Tax=Puccinia coronata f. sp. avenae TaxID=200324 RepID=A0A2N5SW89_9BASI|nr:hypothetical protein PCASD_16718 [Puccinia coronata f. sp. avenae]PLW28596.1 hypothetical protein PCASD_20673 [Puccinia coronata f. sp. avenae]
MEGERPAPQRMFRDAPVNQEATPKQSELIKAHLRTEAPGHPCMSGESLDRTKLSFLNAAGNAALRLWDSLWAPAGRVKLLKTGQGAKRGFDVGRLQLDHPATPGGAESGVLVESGWTAGFGGNLTLTLTLLSQNDRRNKKRMAQGEHSRDERTMDGAQC